MKEEKMDPTSFCYWLKGFFEISDAKELTQKQVQIVRDHLDLVFNKVTPNRNTDEVIEEFLKISPQEKQELMFNPKHLINIQPNEPGKLCSPNTPICQPSGGGVTFEEPVVTVYC